MQYQNQNQTQTQTQNQNQNQTQQYSQLGAHEVMEVHEVLTMGINAINQVQVVAPHITNSQLRSIVNNQMQFMVSEYNNLVQAVSQRTNQQATGMGQQAMSQQAMGQQAMGQTATPYRSNINNRPTYGLNNPSTMSPVSSMAQLGDQDVASILLGIHKASSGLKMVASLECADPQLRRIVLQGAVNCSELAYEVWQFMNQQGYYQVPTLKQTTTDTFVNTYSTANNINVSNAGPGAFNATNVPRQYQ